MQARQPKSIAASIAGLTTFTQANIQQKIDNTTEYATILQCMHDSLLFTDDKAENTELCRELFEKTENSLLHSRRRVNSLLPETHNMQTLADVYDLLRGSETVFCVLTPAIHRQLLTRVAESWLALGIYEDLFTKMIVLKQLTVENVLLSVQYDLNFILVAFKQFQSRAKQFNTNLALPQLLEHADIELMQTLDDLFKPLSLQADNSEAAPAAIRKMQRQHVIICLLAFFDLYQGLEGARKYPPRNDRIHHIKTAIAEIMTFKLENDEDIQHGSKRMSENFNARFKRVMAEYNAVLSYEYLKEHTSIQSNELLSAIRKHVEIDVILQLMIKHKVFTHDKQKNTDLCRLLFTIGEPATNYSVCANLFEEVSKQHRLTYDTALLALQPALYRIHAKLQLLPDTERALPQLLEHANLEILNKLAALSVSEEKENEFSSDEPDNGAHVFWCLLQYFNIYESLKNKEPYPDRNTRAAEILSMIKSLSDNNEYQAHHARFYSVMHLSAQQQVENLQKKYRVQANEPKRERKDSCVIC